MNYTDFSMTTSAMSTELAADSARVRLDALRNRINEVADPLSREGTLSDTLGVLMMSYADLITAIATAQDLKSVRAAAERQGLVVKALTDGAADGTLRFPFQAKQVDPAAVVNEFVELNKGVSAAFEQEGWVPKTVEN